MPTHQITGTLQNGLVGGSMIDVETLKAHLHYDPLTGIFTRLITTSHRNVAGQVSGGYGARGYYRVSVLGRRYYAHRLAWFYMHGEWPQEIDHINGKRDDNRIANLRPANREQNCANVPAKSSNSSGYKNVSFDRKTGKWMARGRANGKRKNLGLFDTPEAAYNAWVCYSKPASGDFFNPLLRWA
jgi:hypothetical protein